MSDNASSSQQDSILPTVKADVAGTADEAVGQTLGRYKLLEKIGEGGCGMVYVAEQTEPVRRRVALKVIKLGMDTKVVIARFEAERQALAMMDHPNIARVLDAGATEAGRPYFVMELVRGIRITDYCDQSQLPTVERIQLFIKVCQAIQHAHQKGIIHRDIKPSNILVTLHDGMPVPKVIDFGIAKATEGRLVDSTVYTQLHQFIGTPAYMSPEQAEMSGLDIDTRSDIYSLGVLFYELLTGKTPFDPAELMASGLDGMRKTIREKEPTKPSTRVATLRAAELTSTAKRRSIDQSKLPGLLRGDLDWIVMKCLEKDRTRRYDTANGLAADLKRHLNNEPVYARPPNTLYRCQKAFRRNKLVFAAAGCVLAALLVGLAISIWQYAGKSRAEREQHRLRQQAEAKALEARQAQQQAAQQRDLAKERLYESLVREAGSIRKARQAGYRREVFDRLKQAIALQTRNLNGDVLRREAAACLGDWLGLDPVDFTLSQSYWSDALTPDGSLAAVGLGNGHLTLRDTKTGREVSSFSLAGSPASLAFDRKGLALFVSTVEWDGRSRPKPIHLGKWSIRGNGSWSEDWNRAPAGYTVVALTAAGPVAMALGRSDSDYLVIDLEKDQELARVPVKNEMPPLPVAAISSDRRRLAFFSLEQPHAFDVQLEVWDLQSTQSLAVIRPKFGPGHGLSFAPDGRTLVASYDNTMVVYETERFTDRMTAGGAFEGTYGAAIGSRAGLLAVPSMQEMAVRLIHLQSGSEVAHLKLPSSAVGVRFSENGAVLLVNHRSGSRVIHLNVDHERINLVGHRGGVPAVEFRPHSPELASAGKDRTLRVWDLAAPGQFRVLGELPAPGQTLAYSPDGQFLVCGYYNTSALSVWSAVTGQRVAIVAESESHRGTTWASAISPNGRHLAAIGNGLRVWDLAQLVAVPSTPARALVPFISESNGVAAVKFHPSGDRLAYLGLERFTESGLALTRLMTRQTAADARPLCLATNSQGNYVQALDFLPNDGTLAYVTRGREIAIFETSTGRLVRSLPTREAEDASPWFVGNLRISPDQSKLAMVTPSGLGVDIRQPLTGKLLYTLPEENGAIWWLAWSQDSQRLAVTRATGEISIWDLRAAEQELAQLGLPD